MSDNDYEIIEVTGRLDAGNATEFKRMALDYLNGDKMGLIISFKETDFLDSAGLGALVSTLKSASQLKKKVALASLSKQVRQIFELTKLYRLFDIFSSVEEAEGAIRNL